MLHFENNAKLIHTNSCYSNFIRSVVLIIDCIFRTMAQVERKQNRICQNLLHILYHQIVIKSEYINKVTLSM